LDQFFRSVYGIIKQTIELLFNCYKEKTLDLTILDEYTAAHVAELFRTFSDTSRVRILFTMIKEEMNTSRIAEMNGLTESAVSHHLRGLRQLRIVQARRDGKEVFYSVVDPHLVALFEQGVRHVQDKS
jgi:ArsR family transcriptional regulator, lead/cadmium/zinc/bismuth-responsive transcriptional repressor